jgi:hypothetical protein
MPQDIQMRISVKVGPRLYVAGLLGLLSKYLDRKALALAGNCVTVVGNGK